MGKLGDKAREKSPFLRLKIGEKTPPMVYKGWKEIVNTFGEDSFRYFFEVATETGLINKTLDVSSTAFAEKMDEIDFGTKVIISREQKVDKDGNEILDKSFYEVTTEGQEKIPF